MYEVWYMEDDSYVCDYVKKFNKYGEAVKFAKTKSVSSVEKDEITLSYFVKGKRVNYDRF